MSYRFAIIGGGLTAVSMLCQLVDELQRMGDAGRARAARLELDIFEKHAVVGPGLPHNADYVLPYHITNMCAKDMTVRVCQPDDFQRWVTRHHDRLSHRFVDPTGAGGECTDGERECTHYPREIMGEYLMNQFAESVRFGRELGLTIRVRTECEVVDAWRVENSFCLRGNEGCRQRNNYGPFQGILLATGHWFEKTPVDNYFSSPWPASNLLEAIPPGADVGVIGSSLSGIETALTLSADGRFRRLHSGRLVYDKAASLRHITLFSRTGLVPRVRGRIGSRRNRYLTCARVHELMAGKPNQLILDDIFVLLDRELSAAYGQKFDWHRFFEPGGSAEDILRSDIDRACTGDGQGGDVVWQTVLVQLFPVVRALYLSLDEGERQRFDRQFTTRFFQHAATQPVINAEKLLALMEGGIVEIKKLGTSYRFGTNDSTGAFEFIYTGTDGRSHRDSFPFCVDARGQPISIKTNRSELIRNLLKRGLVLTTEPHRAVDGRSLSGSACSIRIDPVSHLVVPLSGAVHDTDPQLFAVGAMTRGQIIDASMAHGLARSTQTIAGEILRRLG